MLGAGEKSAAKGADSSGIKAMRPISNYLNGKKLGNSELDSLTDLSNKESFESQELLCASGEDVAFTFTFSDWAAMDFRETPVSTV